MSYMGDRDFWNLKFKERGKRMLSPDEKLVENIQMLKFGSALDLACGDGRNTLLLLEEGFKVTALDFSEKGLDRLKTFCENKGYRVNTKCVDLCEEGALNKVGIFDNIIINHYKLGKANLSLIHKNISKDGILFINGFGHKHKVDDRIKEEDLIKGEDFNKLKKYFQLEVYEEYKNEIGFFVTYIFKRV